MVVASNPKVNSSTKDLEADLTAAIGGEVRFDAVTRHMYSTDASIYQMEPIGVVIPIDADDVSAILEIASKNGVSVLPRGGGTALSGQTVNHAVVVDFSKYMFQVQEINKEEKWVRTQPGVTIDDLNRQLRSSGLFFTSDPSTSSRANIGGAIGNNSCGAHSIVYGKTVDHVKEMNVVLSDGTQTSFQQLSIESLESKRRSQSLEGQIYRQINEIAVNASDEVDKRFPKILRRVGGYNLDLIQNNHALNLAKLAVGSEGTLIAVTATKLNIEPIPKFKGLSIFHFTDITSAMEGTVATLEEQPDAVEHIGEMIISQARQSLGFSRNLSFLQGDPSDILVVEMTGESAAEVEAKLDRLEKKMQKGSRPYATTRLSSAQQQAEVWAMRQAGLGLMMNIPGSAKPLPFVEDTAVSPEKLPEYVKRFDEIVNRNGTTAGYYGHASVGCLHIRPVVDLKNDNGIKTMERISDEISDLVLEFGGSLSGEHGDGIVRGAWADKMFGPELVEYFREVKIAFDPHGVMNPNKIFDTPSLTDNLRYGNKYTTFSPPVKLDWSAEGGFVNAVEKCNGVGACRKVNAGAMCPSYQATREEMHSTRGRANTLRSVLSGSLPKETLHSKELFEVFSLCVECKSCKSECPSNVDMAKIKSEFLYGYNKKNGTPITSRFIGNIHSISAMTIPLAPIFNFVTGTAAFRFINEKLFGFDRRRKLPPLVTQTFESWFKKRAPNTTGTRGNIVLFHDTFMNFNHPESGIGATRILEALGFNVQLADRKCCGRPMISKGLLDKAASNARHNVDVLYKYVQAGAKIVGCESSCIMTLKDEYPDLLPGNKRAKSVAEATVMLEELIEETLNDGTQQIDWNDKVVESTLQVHCHEQALTGTQAALKVMNMPPNYSTKLLEAGCCGMAGSFGFEKKHYDVSMKMGEDRLFPALRASSPEVSIAVTGVSCRQQVEDGVGRPARFLSDILAEAID